MERLTRDEYGAALARTVASRAACTRRQVGAVILNEDARIVATGYNGTGKGWLHCTDGGCPRGLSDEPIHPVSLGNNGHKVPCIAKHAEYNAIVWVLDLYVRMSTALDMEWLDLHECTLYVTAHPCPECTDLIEKVGIKRVVVVDGEA